MNLSTRAAIKMAQELLRSAPRANTLFLTPEYARFVNPILTEWPKLTIVTGSRVTENKAEFIKRER